MSRINILVVVIALASLVGRVNAELTIEVTRGVDNATPIAIVPIKLAGSVDVSAIVAEDLRRSGLFEVMPRANMLSNPATAREVYFRDWRVVGMEYVVVGQVVRQPDNRIEITFSLLEIPGERTLFTQVVKGFDNELRDVSHYISDKVYEAITGIRGVFSTRLAYVTMISEQGEPVYRLMVSDADGARERLMLKSVQPIMSPAWSPDGAELVYVSFETGRPAIFRQRLSDAKREQVTNFKGLNSAPVWSPDGQSLAMVLSKDGNPEIYLYSLATKKFTRMTHHFAIDTEPNWAPDGKSMVFTSDRGGTPQVYSLKISNGDIKRLTFAGTYNARPLLSPDGESLIMVHRSGGIFHIASQHLVRGDLRILTATRLDESPTIAPNGAMLLYATKAGDKGVLAAVSLDAGVKYFLPVRLGDVREPAWSPFLR